MQLVPNEYPAQVWVVVGVEPTKQHSISIQWFNEQINSGQWMQLTLPSHQEPLAQWVNQFSYYSASQMLLNGQWSRIKLVFEAKLIEGIPFPLPSLLNFWHPHFLLAAGLYGADKNV